MDSHLVFTESGGVRYYENGDRVVDIQLQPGEIVAAIKRLACGLYYAPLAKKDEGYWVPHHGYHP